MPVRVKAMLQAFVITLREGLEAFLIIAISLAYLRKSQRAELILAAVASKDTTLGMCLVDVRRCAEEIARLAD